MASMPFEIYFIYGQQRILITNEFYLQNMEFYFQMHHPKLHNKRSPNCKSYGLGHQTLRPQISSYKNLDNY